MTPRFRPAPSSRRRPRPTLSVEPLEERVAPAAGLPPDLVVGRTLSAYSTQDVRDRTLAVTYTVYNQRADAVGGVLLTTTLQPGVAYTTATSLPDRSGPNLAWSLGTLPGYGRASVTLTVNLPDPLPLQIDGGATAFGTLNAGTASADTPAVTLTTRPLPADQLAATPDANTADPFVQEQAAKLRYDPAAIFDYLNRDVGYESYTGSLRGARGTLWSAAGNALDEASLGVALMRASGVPARYARGTLPDDLSRRLILSMFPAGHQTVGYLDPGTELADPANDPKLLAEARDHYWLQADTGSGFRSADTSGLGATAIGAAYTTTTDTFTAVADGLRHKVRVQLDAEVYSQAGALFGLGSGLGTTTVMDHTFDAADLVGKPLTVGSFVTQSSLGALVFTSRTTTYTPYLIVGDDAGQTPDRDHLLTAAPVQEVQTNFPLGSQILTGVFLRVTLSGPDGPPETHTRDLVDRIGPAARRGVGAVTIDPDAPPALSPYDAFTVRALPGRQGRSVEPTAAAQAAAAADVLQRAVDARGPGATAALTAAESAAVTRAAVGLTRYIGAAFHARSDARDAGVAAAARVRSYFDRPRLTLTTHRVAVTGGPAATASATVALDLRRDVVRAVVAPGQATLAAVAYTLTRGLTQARLEADMFAPPAGGPQVATPVAPVNTAAVFDAADAQGVPIVLLDPGETAALDRLDLPADPKARIAAALAAGKAVFVPQRAVTVNGRADVAWFELDPASGAVIGVTADGGHQSFGEYVVAFLVAGALVTIAIVEFLPELAGTAIGLLLSVRYHTSISFGSVNGLRMQPGELFPSFAPGQDPASVRRRALADLQREKTWAIDTFAALANIIDFKRSLVLKASFEKGIKSALSGIQGVDPPVGNMLFAPGEVAGTGPLALNPNAARGVAGGLVAGAVVGTVAPSSAAVRGAVAVDWAGAGPAQFAASELAAAAATVTDAAGRVVGTGAVGLTGVGTAAVTVTGPAAYRIAGTGLLAFYPGTGPGLTAAGEWDAYEATAAGDLTLTVAAGGLTLNGAALPAGTYTVRAAAARITGRGPTAAPVYAGTVTIDTTGGTVTLGPAAGELVVAGGPLAVAGGLALGGYQGRLTVAAGGPGVGSVTLAGTAAAALTIAGDDAGLTTDANPPVALPAVARSSFADPVMTYYEAPDGWLITADGATVTATPSPGAAAGDYPIRVTAVSTADPGLAVQRLFTVRVTAPAAGVELSITPDPLFTVRVGQAELPAGWRAAVRNLGPAADTYTVTAANLPAGFALLTSGSPLTVPAGRTGVLGLYLQPVAGSPLPAPGTVLTFTVTATSTTDPTLTRTQTVSFTMPAVHGVTLTPDPNTLGLAPGVGGQVGFTLRAVGNVPETVTLSVVTSAGLTLAGLPETVSLAPGQAMTLVGTLTAAADVPLNSTLSATLTAALGPTAPAETTRQVFLPVRVAVPGADAILSAAGAAAAAGNTDLANRLTDLGTALTTLFQNPAGPVPKSQAVAALDAVAPQLAADPYLAPLVPGLAAGRAVLDAAGDGPAVRDAITQLGNVLGEVGDTLAAADAHGFALSLPANAAVAQPLTPAAFNVLLRNTGSETTTYDLAVEGLPAGVAAAFNLAAVTLAPGQSTFTPGNPNLVLTLTPGAGEVAAFGFAVRATARPAAAITRAASGSLSARAEAVTVVAVTPAPAFVDPGGTVAVSARILNAVNRRQAASVRFVLTDAGGAVRFTSAAVPVELTVLTTLTTVGLGDLDTTGLPAGDYTLTATVSDAAGRPIPGATGRGHLLVGSPVTASLGTDTDTLPAGTGTVTTTLQVGNRTADQSPFELVGQASSPGSNYVVRNGSYLYVASSAGIRVYDIAGANLGSPQLVRTVGGAFTSGLRLRGDLLVGYGTTGANASGSRIDTYSLADPADPQPLGTVGLPYGSAANVAVTDTHVFVVLVNIWFFLPNSIFAQTGGVLAVNIQNPAAPFLDGDAVTLAGTPAGRDGVDDGVLFNDYGTSGDGVGVSGFDLSAGRSNTWSVAQVSPTLLLVTASSSTGNVTQAGTGLVHLVDVSDPRNMRVVRSLQLPGTVHGFGLAAAGTRAFVTATEGGLQSAPGLPLAGRVVLAAIDLAAPAAPLLVGQRTTDLLAADGVSNAFAVGDGLFAFAGGVGAQKRLYLTDAGDPSNLLAAGFDVPAAVNSVSGGDGLVFTTDGASLIVYRLRDRPGQPVTARVTVPTAAGVAVAPGSFSLAPTRTVSAAGGTTYEWDWTLAPDGGGRTVTWQETVADLQPGRSRVVATAGEVSFVAGGTPGRVPLADPRVTAAQIVGLDPPTRTAVPGQPAAYTVRLLNPTAADVTYALTVPGVPAGWVTLAPAVSVPANGSADVPLTLRSESFAAVGGYGFTVAVSGSNGAAAEVQGDLVLQGVLAPVDPTAYGVVLALAPTQVTAGRGTPTRVAVRVTNTGSATADFALGVAGLPAWVAAAFDRAAVSVPPGAGNFREVTLVLTPAADAPPGPLAFTVSAAGRATATTAGTLTVSAAGVAVALDRRTGAPGDTFRLTVTNTGTAADTFALSVAGPGGLVAALGADRVTLAAGESRAIELTTAAAGFAVAGGLTLFASAVSAADPAVRAADAATLAVPPTVGLAAALDRTAVELPAPGGASFVLTIENTGNTEDAYRVEVIGPDGPIVVALVGLDGADVSAIDTLRLPGLSTGQVRVTAALTAGGTGTFSVLVTSLTGDRAATVSARVSAPVPVSPPPVSPPPVSPPPVSPPPISPPPVSPPPVSPPPVPPPPVSPPPVSPPAVLRPRGYVAGAGVGRPPEVMVYDADGRLRLTILAYPADFTGGVTVAYGDVTGDGVDDVVTGTGPGGGPLVRVFDGRDGSLVAETFAYDPDFRGGVFVAVGRLDPSGPLAIVTGAGAGGGPHVRTWRLTADGLAPRGGPAGDFMAYDPAFRGGVSVAAADRDGDGIDEVVTGAGPGGGPHVTAFDAATRAVRASFFAYAPDFAGGVYVGGGFGLLVTGPGAGGGPDVRVYRGANEPAAGYFAYAPFGDPGNVWSGGVRVAVGTGPDGSPAVLTAAADGPGGGPHVRRWAADTLAPVDSVYAFDPAFQGGVYVA